MFRNPLLFLIHGLCGLLILMAGAWAFAGVDIGGLTRLYAGEVVSVWSFGLSWIVAGCYLTAPTRTGPRPVGTGQSPAPDAAMSK